MMSSIYMYELLLIKFLSRFELFVGEISNKFFALTCMCIVLKRLYFLLVEFYDIYLYRGCNLIG